MKKHVLIEDEMFFMSFKWKCVNAIQSGWVGLMGVQWVKKFWSWEKNALSWEESENGWKVWVFTLEKLGWNGKTWKFKAKSSFLTKIQVSSHS